jgi:hypothetical protein
MQKYDKKMDTKRSKVLKKKKKDVNKDSLCSHKNISSPNKREICFKEHRRIRLATIYIHQIFHIHAYLDLIV